MAEVFELKIISPDAMFFEGEADFLEFTSVEGGMGVYKNHIPLTTILVAMCYEYSQWNRSEESGNPWRISGNPAG